MTVVSELVGLGEEHRSRMLEWAAAIWDVQRPANDRFTAAMPLVDEFIGFPATSARS